MESLKQYATELRQLYEVEKKSLRVIAKKFNTYPLAVYRALISLKIKVRDKSEATKEALRSGRLKHPTKGTHLRENTKDRISKAVSDSWKNMTNEEKDVICKKHKVNWENKTEEEKEELYKKSHEAINKSARTGSALEKYLLRELTASGYNCYAHLNILENEKLEVDLALLDRKIVIELDGPSHFSPIWGEEQLKKTQAADGQKNGLLILNGYKVIRVLYTKNHLSRALKKETLSKLVEAIEGINEDLTYITI